MRDFIPEEKGVPAVPTLAGRDFIPEGGLPPGTIQKAPRWNPKEGREAADPPKGAPLLEKDFIHEVTVPEGGGEEAPGPAAEEAPPERKAPEVPLETEPERPPMPTKEDREAMLASHEAPPGYFVKGVDDAGEPIFQKKPGKLSQAEQKAKAEWEKKQREEEESGSKGGESHPSQRERPQHGRRM